MRVLMLCSVAGIGLAFDASAAFAGCIIPMPEAGMAGSLAMLVALGTAGAVKYWRSQPKD